MEQPLTTAEVATFLKRKPATVTRWKRSGLIHPIRGTGGRSGYLFSPDEVRRFVNSKQCVEAY